FLLVAPFRDSSGVIGVKGGSPLDVERPGQVCGTGEGARVGRGVDFVNEVAKFIAFEGVLLEVLTNSFQELPCGSLVVEVEEAVGPVLGGAIRVSLSQAGE
ncbi:hypothetical protein C0992_012590, partial [Termitomyces sp. T32_za158]